MTQGFIGRHLQAAGVRFAAIYVLMFAGSALVLGVTVFVEARSALRQQADARIEGEATFLQEEYRSGGLQRLLDVVGTRGRGVGALDYLVQSRDGAHLAGEMPAHPSMKDGWLFIDVPQATEDGGRPERVRALATELPDGPWLAVGSDVRQVEELERAIVTAFVWTVGLAALLGVTGGVLLSRAFLGRVDAISRTAEAIIGGDMARRVPVRGTGDDLDRLAGTLNRMLDRIAVLMESVRQAGTDVAHDLRTPLSRLYQKLEDVQSRAVTTDDYRTAVDGALREADGLLETFAALLRIAQVEGSSPRDGFRLVDLSDIVATVAEAYRPAIEDGGYVLDDDIAEAVRVWGDRELLTQAMSNLVENALRHTMPGTRISVRLRNDGKVPSVSVADNGPGVDALSLPQLTNRFFRTERSRTTPGNGLGLSLVNAVADLHGARLRIENARPGLRAVIDFPAEADVRPQPSPPAPSVV